MKGERKRESERQSERERTRLEPKGGNLHPSVHVCLSASLPPCPYASMPLCLPRCMPTSCSGSQFDKVNGVLLCLVHRRPRGVLTAATQKSRASDRPDRFFSGTATHTLARPEPGPRGPGTGSSMTTAESERLSAYSFIRTPLFIVREAFTQGKP